MVFKVIYFMLISTASLVSIGFFARCALDNLPNVNSRFGIVARVKRGLASGEALSFGVVDIPVPIYNAARFSVLGIWLVLAVLLKILKGLPSFGMQIFLIIILIIFTTPRSKMGRIKLPFLYVSDFFKKRAIEASNREIYRTISELINLFTIKGEVVLGSNYILEEVVKNAKVTKPVYLKMLSLWNMNRREEAANYFSTAIGTKEARDLAGVFLKLDYLNPAELKGQLLNYYNNIKAERITARERVNERNGNLIYILAIVSAVVVLLNFLVVVLTDVFTSYSLLSF
jgi:hypothetical protein